jgi:hypothetical protein
MEKKRPRWVDKPEFAWTPETPLHFEPTASTKVPAEPDTAPAIVDARFPESATAPRETRPANDPLPPAANSNRPAYLLVPRLGVGLAQGLVLSALFAIRDFNLWPGSAAALLAGLTLATGFMPLLLLQGLGRIPARPLLIWTMSAAIGLTGLGAYHHWRISGVDAAHSGLWLAAMIMVFLFVGQSLFLGHARNGPGPARYAALYESSWKLLVETLLCGMAALLAWALSSVVESVLRPIRTGLPLAYLAAPLVTLSLAVAAQFCGRGLLHLLERGLTLAFTILLPPLLPLTTFTLLFWVLRGGVPPLGLTAAEGLLLVIAINASYRGGGEWRSMWRRRLEFMGALLLLPLALCAAIALQARIAELGYTAPRVVAMACVLMLSAYAVAYACAALISLSGGRWMERLEHINLAMAFVGLTLVAALASPLADPVRLAVASQNWRIMQGKVAPEAFDFTYLRNGGLRFGHDVLTRLAVEKSNPAIAQAASALLDAEPYQAALP